MPLKEGGLGVRKLSTFNEALLGKWLWRYKVEREISRKRVVLAKYGNEWGDWMTKSMRGSHVVVYERGLDRGERFG